MWDGRETFRDTASTDCVAGTTTCFASNHFDLADQSNAATLGHAQAATPLTAAQREAIVRFETGLFTAQVFDFHAGALMDHGARRGPVVLSQETFYVGINDTLAGDYRTRAPFVPVVMTLFDAWAGAAGARGAVARGQALFNGKPIAIHGRRKGRPRRFPAHALVERPHCFAPRDAQIRGVHPGLTRPIENVTCPDGLATYIRAQAVLDVEGPHRFVREEEWAP